MKRKKKELEQLREKAKELKEKCEDISKKFEYNKDESRYLPTRSITNNKFFNFLMEREYAVRQERMNDIRFAHENVLSKEEGQYFINKFHISRKEKVLLSYVTHLIRFYRDKLLFTNEKYKAHLAEKTRDPEREFDWFSFFGAFLQLRKLYFLKNTKNIKKLKDEQFEVLYNEYMKPYHYGVDVHQSRKYLLTQLKGGFLRDTILKEFIKRYPQVIQLSEKF